MAQLLHVMVVKKLVRSLSECKQTTRHTHGSHPQSPRPPKGIKRIQMKCSIEWARLQGQKRVKSRRKRKRRMQLTWNKAYPHHENNNTKPKHLIHAARRPPRRSILNATSICALEREKQAWDEVVMTKRKTGKTDQKLTLTAWRQRTTQILLPNTLSTSNIRSRKASINQIGGRANAFPSTARWRRDARKGKNRPTLLIFFDDYPKPLPNNHYRHSLIHWMPNEYSERMERKDGETMTKIEKRKRTTLTCGRPIPTEGSALVSLRIFNQNQPKNNGYMRHFNTILMNVHT